MKPYCCYIDPDDGSYCSAPAALEINESGPDSETHSCATHLSDLLPDDGAHVSWLEVGDA